MNLFYPLISGTKRRPTSEVLVGNVGVGGANPIRIQSMTTSNTRDVHATVEQIIRLADEGCEIVRLTVQGMKEADSTEQIKNQLLQKGYTIPIVADIHFFPAAALRVVEFVDKVRINPGNYVDKRASFKRIEYDDLSYTKELEKIEEKFTPLVEQCKRLKRAMRIGTNHGSLSDRIMNRYGDTPRGMVESAFEFARVCRKLDYHDLIFSMKASNPQVMISAYRLLVQEMEQLGWDYPLHLGVTEAGAGEDGRIKSAIGIGSLLLEGLGDTIRVSLTEDPWNEIDPCKQLIALAKHSYQSGENQERYIPLLTQKSAIRPRQSPGIQFSEGGIVLPIQSPLLKIESRELSLQSNPRFLSDERYRQHFSQKRERKPIDYNPFSLHRDGSVIVSVTAQDLLDPGLHEKIGFDQEMGGFKKKPTSIDCLVIEGDLPSVCSDLIDTLATSGITLFSATAQNPHIVPILSFDEALQVRKGSDQRECALLIKDAPPESWPFIELLAPSLIFLQCSSHRVQYSRALMTWLDAKQIKVPVILSFSYEKRDHLLIDAAAECGSLLCDGFGDGLWIRAAAPILFLCNLSLNLLQGARKRIFKTDFISCPSCGRTLFDLQEVSSRIREKTAHLPGVKIAIMGCIVNGPGEMADADFGYVGSKPGMIDLYLGKECVEKDIPFEQAEHRLIEMIQRQGRWVEKEAENR